MLITRDELALHPITVHETYSVGEIDERGGRFHQAQPLEVHALAELAGLEIHIKGRLETRLEVECDRCIALMEYPIRRNFDLYYRPVSSIAREEEIEIPPDELDIAFYSEEGIDLTDLVREQVILALPMKIVCQPECRGLCPICGINLNWGACQCQSRNYESPFASLRGQ
jgi:uncharacterized protein